MAKRKDSTALFEAMLRSRDRQAREGFASPGRLDRQGEQAAGVSAQPVLKSVDRPAASVAPVASGGWGLPAPATAAQGGELPPNRRLMLFGVLAVAALIAVAFMLGRRSATQEEQPLAKPYVAVPTPKNSVPVPSAKPTPSVNAAKTSGGAALTAEAKTPTAGTERIVGKYYLVVERTKAASPEDKAEADKIVKFLAEHNEPAEVVLAGQEDKRMYAVWSLRPFDDDKSEATREFALAVEKLGAEYETKHGNYRFQQRIKRTSELTPLYRKYTAKP